MYTLFISFLISNPQFPLPLSIIIHKAQKKKNECFCHFSSTHHPYHSSGRFYDGNSKLCSARELVCDAFGKCEHKITSALDGTKDTVFEKAHEIEEAFEKVKDRVVGQAHEASKKAKECGGKKVEEVKEGAKKTAKKVKEKAKDVSETSNTLQGDVKRNATEDLDIIEDAVKADAHRLKVEGKRGYQEIGTLFSHVSTYTFSSNCTFDLSWG